MSSGEPVDVHALALEKVGRILGPARAQALLASFLGEWPRRERLKTPEDLYAFGRRLAQMQGMEQAVGALLTMQAVMLGAPGDPGSSGSFNAGKL
jgi:hypothetical protein